MNQKQNKTATAFRPSPFGIIAVAVLLGVPNAPAAHAQIQYLNLYSANTLTNASDPNYSKNLTTVTNGVTAYSNTVTLLFSATYDQAAHALGTLSSPTPAGTGNNYTGTAYVSRNTGLASYDGGAVAGAGVLSPFSSDTGGGSVGYYLFQVPFTMQAAAGQGYSLNGSIHSDNAAYDVILDYGTADQAVLTLTGTNIRTNSNVATTNGVFSGNATQTTLNASHTLSYIIYNNSGATTTSFSGYMATPEPPSLALLAVLGGLVCPAAAVWRRRRGGVRVSAGRPGSNPAGQTG